MKGFAYKLLIDMYTKLYIFELYGRLVSDSIYVLLILHLNYTFSLCFKLSTMNYIFKLCI